MGMANRKLLRVSAKGRLEKVRAALESGANIDIADAVSWCHQIIYDNFMMIIYCELILYLFVAIKDGETALSKAAQNGHMAVVQHLLSQDARIDATDKVYHNTS